MKKIDTGKQSRSIKFTEDDEGKFPQNIISAFLEWVLIIILFLDGFISFAASEFAKLFRLKTPCLLCTRLDHVLARRNPNYYNDSICSTHKKEVSCLAYCHVHKKLSDIRKMCEACLLSFATEKETDCDTYKSLVGILHKDVECFVEDDMQLSWPVKKDEGGGGSSEKNFYKKCSCCDTPMKVKSMHVRCKNPSQAVSQVPTPSPRAPRSLEIHPGEGGDGTKSRDEGNWNEDKTPMHGRGNKVFGISIAESTCNSPRRLGRKSPMEPIEGADAEPSILNHLNRQGVRLDRKSLMALYMELDEERNASAVAANNAMAMITRLQAEKASVQMEALQYQRMMEEQAEYDEEELQQANDIITKKEEEIRDLQIELEAYQKRCANLDNLDDGDTRADYLQGKHGEETRGKPSQEVKGESEYPEASSSEFHEEKPICSLDEEKPRCSLDEEKPRCSLDEENPRQHSKLKKPEKDHSDDEHGSDKKSILTAELVTNVLERLKAIETNGKLSSKAPSEAAEGRSDVIKLLREISQDLEKLWLVMTIKSDDTNA